MFDSRIIEIRNPELETELPVDEVVLKTARIWNVSEVLVDDELLFKRIVRNGSMARRSADVFCELTAGGHLDISEYLKFLNRMVERQRLSNDRKIYYENEVMK